MFGENYVTVDYIDGGPVQGALLAADVVRIGHNCGGARPLRIPDPGRSGGRSMGGFFDGTFSRPFESDSIVQGYSSTKTITALCALVLADRCEIDLDAPVARYWPEFAEGK